MYAKPLGILAMAAAVLMLAVGCGGPSGVVTATANATVLTGAATVGGKSATILTDSKGVTLYYFTPDKGGKVTCTGGCLAIWPPLLLPSGTAQPTAGSGVTGSLTTVANPDGKETQVVYNNWPLYYYVKDAKPGDVAGQNLGNKWFVVPPDLAP
jgi:predicted lipoprotein with Yx(FWY)xxD motif